MMGLVGNLVIIAVMVMVIRGFYKLVRNLLVAGVLATLLFFFLL